MWLFSNFVTKHILNDEMHEALLGIASHSKQPSVHAEISDVDHVDGIGLLNCEVVFQFCD